MSEDKRDECWSVDPDEALRRDKLGYDPETETYYVQYDEEDVADLTTKIVKSVAAITGETPLDLEALYTVIDPGVLQKLFETPRSNPTEHEGVYVTFEFASCELTISWDGEIRITPPDDVSTHGTTTDR